MSYSKKILFFFVGIFLFLFSANQVLASVKTPMIISAVYEKGVVKVVGLTEADSQVYVDIDGEIKGQAQVESKANETDSYAFLTKYVLAKGDHAISVQAVNPEDNSISNVAKKIITLVELPLPAPTLVAPNKSDAIGQAKPLIIGLSRTNTLVHVYIDGIHYGKTNWLSHKSGTANFAYEPFLSLEVGYHQAWAVAEDENGRKSKISNILEFKVEHPMPAPTMFQPVVNASSTASQPFMVGLAKNNSEIRVYVDNKLNGSFMTTNHASGVASFAYKIPRTLTRGTHIVYSQALDSRGKISRKSNIVYYTVKEPQIGQSAEAVETSVETQKENEEKTADEVITEEKQVETVKELIDTIDSEPEIKTEEVEKVDEFKVDDIEKSEKEPSLAAHNATLEDKEDGNLKLNIVIFILFLLGITGWIIWVNKELIKERREAEDNQANKIGKNDKQ